MILIYQFSTILKDDSLWQLTLSIVIHCRHYSRTRAQEKTLAWEFQVKFWHFHFSSSATFTAPVYLVKETPREVFKCFYTAVRQHLWNFEKCTIFFGIKYKLQIHTCSSHNASAPLTQGVTPLFHLGLATTSPLHYLSLQIFVTFGLLPPSLWVAFEFSHFWTPALSIVLLFSYQSLMSSLFLKSPKSQNHCCLLLTFSFPPIIVTGPLNLFWLWPQCGLKLASLIGPFFEVLTSLSHSLFPDICWRPFWPQPPFPFPHSFTYFLITFPWSCRRWSPQFRLSPKSAHHTLWKNQVVITWW